MQSSSRSIATRTAAPVIPDFKKLARELVVNLVDCGGLDEGVKEKYLEWVEKNLPRRHARNRHAGGIRFDVIADKSLSVACFYSNQMLMWSA